MHKLRIARSGFGTARQETALERGTSRKLPRRTCSPRYGLQSWRGKPAGVAKRYGSHFTLKRAYMVRCSDTVISGHRMSYCGHSPSERRMLPSPVARS
jgi:hypothetical protein